MGSSTRSCRGRWCLRPLRPSPSPRAGGERRMVLTSGIPAAATERAMRRALELAASPGGPLGPNPRVGCVLLAPDGSEVAEGFHRGAGTPHAEAAALAALGDGPEAARGATAVVT